jgi:hypothetical protein
MKPTQMRSNRANKSCDYDEEWMEDTTRMAMRSSTSFRYSLSTSLLLPSTLPRYIESSSDLQVGETRKDRLDKIMSYLDAALEISSAGTIYRNNRGNGPVGSSTQVLQWRLAMSRVAGGIQRTHTLSGFSALLFFYWLSHYIYFLYACDRPPHTI